MPTDPDRTRALSPEEAFALLGNETRVAILRHLGEVDGPLSFTALRDRIGLRQGGQFNYHLDKLVGQFIRKTDAGYALRESGRRIIEAVLSGAVTHDPIIEPTEIDAPCTFCGAPIEVSYRQEWLETYCTACPGAYTWKTRESVVEEQTGHLGGASFPPAGVLDRTPEEAFLAALRWGHLRLFSHAVGICPACAASLDREWVICEDHDADDGLCEMCEQRFAVTYTTECPNCIESNRGSFINGIIAFTEVQAFLMRHGINLLAPETNVWARFDFDEAVIATDPVEVAFTLSVDDDSLTIIVDEEMQLVEATP